MEQEKKHVFRVINDGQRSVTPQLQAGCWLFPCGDLHENNKIGLSPVCVGLFDVFQLLWKLCQSDNFNTQVVLHKQSSIAEVLGRAIAINDYEKIALICQS